MSFKKIIFLYFLVFGLCLSVFADDDGLPPKNKPENVVDCGAKTSTELDRQLEKKGPELATNSSETQAGQMNTTVGLSGSTATVGANISDDNLLNLVIGKTKYQDITTLFGKPTTVVRTDDLFFAIYNFTKAETKIDPVTFIPLVGGLFAKNKSNFVQRKVNLKFDPQTGILVSCTKTDKITDPKSESQLDMIKKLSVQ